MRASIGIAMIGALLVVLSPMPSSAQNSNAAQLCTPDVMRLCNEFIPDADRITACMQKKRRQLSAECAAVFKPKRQRRVRNG